MIDFVTVVSVIVGFVIGICVVKISEPERKAHGELIVTEDAEDRQVYMFLALYEGFDPNSIKDGKILLNIKNGNSQN